MTNTTTQSNLTDKEYREVNMFDCTIEELDAMIAAKPAGTMIGNLVGTLSDVQEMLRGNCFSAETIRRTINRVKYMLDHLDQR